VAALKEAVEKLEIEKEEKEAAYVSLQEQLVSLQTQLDGTKEKAADSGNDSNAADIERMQKTLESMQAQLLESKRAFDKVTAETNEAQAAYASAAADVDPTEEPKANHTAVIVVIAVGLILIVAIVAFVIVKRKQSNNAIPTSMQINNGRAAYEQAPAMHSQQGGKAPLAQSYENPMYSSMA